MGQIESLRPVDAVEVTVMVDNAIDVLLPSTEVARRPAVDSGMWEPSASS